MWNSLQLQSLNGLVITNANTDVTWNNQSVPQFAFDVY